MAHFVQDQLAGFGGGVADGAVEVVERNVRPVVGGVRVGFLVLRHWRHVVAQMADAGREVDIDVRETVERRRRETPPHVGPQHQPGGRENVAFEQQVHVFHGVVVGVDEDDFLEAGEEQRDGFDLVLLEMPVRRNGRGQQVAHEHTARVERGQHRVTVVVVALVLGRDQHLNRQLRPVLAQHADHGIGEQRVLAAAHGHDPALAREKRVEDGRVGLERQLRLHGVPEPCVRGLQRLELRGRGLVAAVERVVRQALHVCVRVQTHVVDLAVVGTQL